MAMSDDWKDKPHWVLRFTHLGKWELTGPDGGVKHIDGMGQQALVVSLEMENIPRFSQSGILYQKEES